MLCEFNIFRARVRRPDIQVYVPRAKRTLTENASITKSNDCIPPDRNDICKETVTKKKLCKSSSSEVEYEVDRIETSEPTTMGDITRNLKLSTANLPPRAEALVETKKRLCQTGHEQGNLESCLKSVPSSAGGRSTKKPLLPTEVTVEPESYCNDSSDSILDSENDLSAVIGSEVTRNDMKCNTETNNEEVSQDCSYTNGESPKVNVSEVLPNSERSNLELPLYSSGYTSDSPHSESEGSLSSIESCDVLNKTPNNKENLKKRSPIFNPDECDWDDLLDENGECLDPFLMKEVRNILHDTPLPILLF